MELRNWRPTCSAFSLNFASRRFGISTVARILAKRKTMAYAAAGIAIEGRESSVSGLINSYHVNGVGSMRLIWTYSVFQLLS